MASHREPGETPWYRTTAATVSAGGLGLALIGALVVAVVQLSDDWSTPQNTVLTTPVSSQRGAPTTRDKQPFVITPSDTSTTFTTSVPVSTTDIANPTELTTSPTTETTSGTTSGTTSPTTETTSGTTSPTTVPSPRRPSDTAGENPYQPSATRHPPRYNETRTLNPGY